MKVLPEPEWRARAADHRERVAAITGPHRERARRGETHPVLDFLFTYYSHRPTRLEHWHPGPGIVLAGAPDAPGYRRGGGGGGVGGAAGGGGAGAGGGGVRGRPPPPAPPPR